MMFFVVVVNFCSFAFICICTACMYVCVSSSHGGQKRASNLLGLELQIVSLWILETVSRFSVRTSALDHWAVSPASVQCMFGQHV